MTATWTRRSAIAASLALAVSTFAFDRATAQTEAEFFRGKTVRVIVSTTAGGGYDLRGRALGRHIGKHLPGNPHVVVENMPGGGSVVAMNHTYNIAPKDGTVMLMFQRTVLTAPILSPNGIRFELTKFTWLGSMGQDPGLIVAWHESPIKKTEDIFTKEMIIATTAQTTLPIVLNGLIGTKFKVITGYPGSPEMLLAMQRGEVMGPGEWSWSDLKNSNIYHEKKVNLLLQTNVTRVPELPGVPLALDFAKSENDRKILEVFVSPRDIAYPVVLPPDVPEVRAKTVRDAFMAVGRDPEFQDEIRKAKVEVEMIPAETVFAMVKRNAELPEDVKQRVRTLIGTP